MKNRVLWTFENGWPLILDNGKTYGWSHMGISSVEETITVPSPSCLSGLASTHIVAGSSGKEGITRVIGEFDESMFKYCEHKCIGIVHYSEVKHLFTFHNLINIEMPRLFAVKREMANMIVAECNQRAPEVHYVFS